MEQQDKFTSLSNGLCIQLHWQDWECGYIDQVINSTTTNGHVIQNSQCKNGIPFNYSMTGQKAFSVRYSENQLYDVGYCKEQSLNAYNYMDSSLLASNLTLGFTFKYYNNATYRNAFYVVLYSDVELNLFSVPILRLDMNYSPICPLGFCFSDESRICECNSKFTSFTCNIDSQRFTSDKQDYWLGLTVDNHILVSKHCPPSYCNKDREHFQLNDVLNESSCLGNRTGVLCGECKENFNVVFGSDTCYDNYGG